MAALLNKMFSGTSLMQLIKDVENETKARVENEEVEIKLSFFLLVRKAFDEAYEKVRDQLVANGKSELGDAFSGITGNFIRGSYVERGGAAYKPDPEVFVQFEQAAAKAALAGLEQIPEFDADIMDVEVKVKLKTERDDKGLSKAVGADAIRKYVKANKDLPPGIVMADRARSLSLTPTKESKAFFEELQSSKEDILYDLDIPEIEEGDYDPAR
jgi:hypothetical protein